MAFLHSRRRTLLSTETGSPIVIALSHLHLVVQVEIFSCHAAHRYKRVVDDGDLHNPVHSIDPQISFLGRRREEDIRAGVCFERKTELPLRLFAFVLFVPVDALNADNFTPKVTRQIQWDC